MKKNIETDLALYPTPLVVVRTMVNGKPNYALVGHLGIIGHNRVMISLSDMHYTNKGIRETNVLSVNIVNEAIDDFSLSSDDMQKIEAMALCIFVAHYSAKLIRELRKKTEVQS